jgi:hypothetical protein
MATSASNHDIMNFQLLNLRALLLLCASVLLFGSCDADKCKRCKGSDGVSPISLNKVEKIVVDFDGLVRVFQDTFQFAAVAGKDAAIKNLSNEVVNGTWFIRYDRCITCEEDVVVTLVVPDLKSIDLNSKAKIEALESTNFPNLEIINRAGGFISFEQLQSEQLTITNSGGGDVVLKGSGGSLNLTMTGSGVVRTFEMPFNNVTVSNTASGSVFLTALQNLSVNISGSGNVHYRGAPIITQEISGSGQLINAN